MKWFTCLMCSLVSMVLFSVSAMAFTPPVAEPGRFMYDISGKLSESDRNQINQKLLSINSSTKNEIAVLVVDSLGGDSIDDAANATFKKWGVGKKGLDNGVLIMLALGEHKMRIETGKGVEGELTDLQTQDIMNHKMRPLLKANSVAAAINAGIDGVTSTLDSRKDGGTSTTATPTPHSNNACQVAAGNSFSTGGLLFGLGLGAVFFLLVGRFLLRRKHQDDSKIDRFGSLKFDVGDDEFDDDDDDLPTQPTAVQPMIHSHKFEFNNGESKCSCGETVMPASSKGLGWVAEHKARMEMAEKNANFSEPVHNPPSEEELSRNTKPEGLKRVAKNKVLPAIVAGAAAASAAAELLAAQRDAARRRAEEEEERKATARRQREDDERRERERREEDDRRRSDDSSSSSSSSSSFDYGSSSSDSGFGGSDSGFGGGDSGGGGSDSDF